jgi:CubicO group peptidase (beta-lactamase class C family)
MGVTVGLEEVAGAFHQAPLVTAGDHLHGPIGVVDVVEGDPGGDEGVVGSDGVPAGPVLMPADGGLRRTAGRLEQELVLPQSDGVGAEQVSGYLGHPPVGGQRCDVVIGPPRIVDLAQVVLAGFEGETERGRLAPQVLTGHHASGCLEESAHLVGVEEYGRDPVAVTRVLSRRCDMLHALMSIKSTIDELLGQYRQSGTPGLAVAVAIDDEVVFQGGAGDASLEYGAPIGADTVFHAASVSKQFTAFSIALLAAEGLVDLDGDVRKWLPEVPDFGVTITPRHLIHHVSGLRDQWDLLCMAGWRMEDVITTSDVLALVTAQRELNSPPGSEFNYCNTGYTLLAEIVERAAGMPFAEFGQRRIFEPLGMSRTHWHTDHRTVVPNSAHSYRPVADSFVRAVLSYSTVGATSLWTTVPDLLRWARNLRTGDLGGTDIRDQMQQPTTLTDGTVIEYGFGLMVTPYRGTRMVSHSGGDAAFRSHVATFPDKSIDVAVLSNHGAGDPAGVVRKIADVVLGDGQHETDPTPTNDSIDVTRWAGRYFDQETAAVHTLTVSDGRLAFEGPPPAPLVPVASDRFLVPGLGGIELTFEDSPDGAILRASSTMFHTRAIRVDPSDDSDNADLLGTYRSDELDVTWTIAASSDEEGQLVVARRKYGEVALRPIARRLFRTDFDLARMIPPYTFEFRVADDGDMEMLVTSGRVRRLRFRRVT